MARFLRRVGSLPTSFALAALALGGAALIGATAATGGPAVSTTTPFTYYGSNPCTGETFTGTGNLHLVESDNLSSSGMSQHHFEARIDGLQAVTTPPFLPKKYVVQDTLDDSFGWDTTDGAPSHETFQVTGHFVRQGEDGTFVLGDDFYTRFFAQITANANGDITAQKVDTETTCR
jgi:hypothetical protein